MLEPPRGERERSSFFRTFATKMGPAASFGGISCLSNRGAPLGASLGGSPHWGLRGLFLSPFFWERERALPRGFVSNSQVWGPPRGIFPLGPRVFFRPHGRIFPFFRPELPPGFFGKFVKPNQLPFISISPWFPPFPLKVWPMTLLLKMEWPEWKNRFWILADHRKPLIHGGDIGQFRHEPSIKPVHLGCGRVNKGFHGSR